MARIGQRRNLLGGVQPFNDNGAEVLRPFEPRRQAKVVQDGPEAVPRMTQEPGDRLVLRRRIWDRLRYALSDDCTVA